MPSPIAHALAGFAAGWMVDPAPDRGRAGGRSRIYRRVLLFGTAGAAADLDLLFNAHSGPTHALASAVVAGAMAWIVMGLTARPGRGNDSGGSAAITAAAVALAYASHTLLDWLGSDTSPPIGIMAAWPFSRDYYQSPLRVFTAISRRYWLPEFWTGNLQALVRELIILLPVVAAAVLLRRRRARY